MTVPAIVTAGDGSAAKAVYGQSKVYLELGGRSLVAHVVLALQDVPEVDAVWVVGDHERLAAVLQADEIQRALRKPLHLVPQFRHLWENCWETYRRCLPGAPPEGRDPEGADLDQQALYLSGDLPFATAAEISDFVRRALQLDADYVLGLVEPESLAGFLPARPGEPGIEVAYFNLREARLRQSNLHLVRPGRLGNRLYIEEMYQHRHQREFGNMIALAWRLLWSQRGGASVAFFYLLLHLASIADRWHLRRLADRIRYAVSSQRVERAVGRILDTRFRLLATDAGGCAIDIDTEAEYDASRARYEEWRSLGEERAARLAAPALAAGDARGGPS